MDEIVVIGGGGHAKVLIGVLKKSGYHILGYTDVRDRSAILGSPFLGDDGILTGIIREHPRCRAAIGIGKVDASHGRIDLLNEISALGFIFPVIVSPHAVVNEDVLLEDGTVVFDGVVVNPGTVTGKACILNTGSTIDHDCRLGDNVHIAPGAVISGGVTVGNNSLVGTGARVRQSVSICQGCLIGAGATVVKDISIPGTYVGTPARKIR